MELLNHAVRAELAVPHEQDAAYVDDLLKELETRMREYEKRRADAKQAYATREKSASGSMPHRDA